MPTVRCLATLSVASVFVFVGFTGLCLCGRSAAADDNILVDVYGDGVHAFFNSDLQRAYDLLNRAIEGGFEDPRAYYFRGLTLARSGRAEEAAADFTAGAELEAKRDLGPLVSRALVRIQGSSRMRIEAARTDAKLDFRGEAVAEAKRRYGQRAIAEADVLRQPPQPRTPPRMPRATAEAPIDSTPFDDDAPGQAEVEERDALADADEDPFVDDDMADAPPSDDPVDDADPFATPDMDDTDPFAVPDDMGDSPF